MTIASDAYITFDPGVVAPMATAAVVAASTIIDTTVDVTDVAMITDVTKGRTRIRTVTIFPFSVAEKAGTAPLLPILTLLSPLLPEPSPPLPELPPQKWVHRRDLICYPRGHS